MSSARREMLRRITENARWSWPPARRRGQGVHQFDLGRVKNHMVCGRSESLLYFCSKSAETPVFEFEVILALMSVYMYERQIWFVPRFLDRFVSDGQVGPGLEICLRVGAEKAKALAAQHGK